MSSTEPPSRNAPRNQPQDTKAARDELSSKGKVEKVREIDADEQTRKKKFLQFYKDDQLEDENFQAESRPSPFDLISGKQQTAQGSSSGGLFGSAAPSSFSDEENNIIPSPSYTPPPNVNSTHVEEDSDEDAATEGALPQSDDFWSELNLPDQPTAPASFQEAPGLIHSAGFTPPPQQSKRDASTHSPSRSASGAKEGSNQKGPMNDTPAYGKNASRSKEDKSASLFGPPGKPEAKQIAKNQKLTSPFEQNTKIDQKNTRSQEFSSSSQKPRHSKEAPPKIRPLEKGEETDSVSINNAKGVEKKGSKDERKEEENPTQAPGVFSFKQEEREAGSGDDKDNRDRKVVEIESSSLPTLPSDVQPMAAAATTQAAPYLNPATASLFFQMVGTMYMMSGPQGVSRTEVVLNNPAFANSKFYGSTITIEKYATAPDSFNIRLTGSQEAVATFKDNIPSLMTAFQNGKFAFKVNRLDVEYTIEKPVFRRKGKGEDKGEAGGGDLGERRK